ncbi:4-hydroxythreonine-4-phosphate dehydrogenase PdxA [Microbaculum marinum]|uniref:4-hydroxythreonine-4-phosphate dehydrogenase n=1 Tax=Microbaculum marinum TaxID=1764581 RepID=A0AAW9RSQ2_9HYPH
MTSAKAAADSMAPLAVTMGEPAGIGPELAGQAWQRRLQDGIAPFYCLADPAFLSSRFKTAGLDVPVRVISDAPEAAATFPSALPVLALDNPVRSGRAGAPSRDDAPAVLESIERAVDEVVSGAGRAVMTSPVQKETLYDSGFSFPGHTEFLGDLVTRHGLTARPVMMIASEELRVVPVTIHVPLADVPRLLTTGMIVETAMIVARELTARFGIETPRLAVTGLNPHAGEGARIGLEDRDIVAPAVLQLREAGVAATGPHPADTLFHDTARSGYDAVIAMYHDQALIPIKTIAFETAVNVTLGLPIVRTSPDHGTALPLAGTGRASPSSLIAALRMADRLSRVP